ncbi:MAG: RNA polymerase sigma factor [Betaproteobacteria bacterium]|nr:MAG: RNA polymerase sigma factor [Betaproteobacteria bacterium]
MQDLTAQIVACIPSLRRYARGLTGSRDTADDLVQDTLERAWNRIALWRGRDDPRAWLFSILHNVFIDRFRAQRASPVEAMGEEEVDAPVRATQTDMLEVRDLDNALLRLPADQRAVLLLVAVERMNYEQIANALDIPLGTVMSRLSRARERLRAILTASETVSRLKVVK